MKCQLHSTHQMLSERQVHCSECNAVDELSLEGAEGKRGGRKENERLGKGSVWIRLGNLNFSKVQQLHCSCACQGRWSKRRPGALSRSVQELGTPATLQLSARWSLLGLTCSCYCTAAVAQSAHGCTRNPVSVLPLPVGEGKTSLLLLFADNVGVGAIPGGAQAAAGWRPAGF